MGSKALTTDKRLAKLIYKSILKSANKKYPADVRLDVMLEFIDSLKVTLEGLIKKQARKEQEEAVTVADVDLTKLDEPAQAIARREKAEADLASATKPNPDSKKEDDSADGEVKAEGKSKKSKANKSKKRKK